ncbi:hypothetical protein BC939DRAFT_502908 [Gamsiella multidivaricata]|uniref:uncharacterized protein n=1 Tax=Gamsiella multidivaricata TaxID=101098 RepID=UPI0022202F99|nr:uncharacterized protein BC939DRAFT_502908 [Gamsiella multidivaricata]KAG0369305.1 hypothetical protein BGZ54_010331 [Gamsiella multidivaricata]KAI7824103.1 hypothetical protein BC939DRAFT_502908 [Gamsiella multidivaricata]
MEAAAFKDLSVLIVGAGLSGVMLAPFIEKLGINYTILERSQAVGLLGAALYMSANILPAFEKLGLLEEIQAISKGCPI